MGWCFGEKLKIIILGFHQIISILIKKKQGLQEGHIKLKGKILILLSNY